MTIRKASRSSRMPALHVGLLEYTWRMIGVTPGRLKVKGVWGQGSTALMNYFLHHVLNTFKCSQRQPCYRSSIASTLISYFFFFSQAGPVLHGRYRAISEICG